MSAHAEPLTEARDSDGKVVIGSNSAVTIGLVMSLVVLGVWLGRMSDRLDHVELAVPASADAAKAYTDGQFKDVNVRLDDISARLARIENRMDKGRP